MNVFFAILIFLVGMVLAGAMPPFVSENAMQLQAEFALFILVILLGFPAYRMASLNAVSDPNRAQASIQEPVHQLSTQNYWGRLLGLQVVLFYLSLIFFYTLESITRLNPRLQPLQEGRIFAILQESFFQTSFIPWVLYGLLGVGLAYFTVCKGRYPTLPKLIFPKPRGKFQWFVHNYFHIGVDAVMLAPFIWLLPICMIWCCEGLNSLCELPSLFASPQRSIFILGFLCLFCNRTHRKLLDAMEQFKIPMGTMLVVYVLLGAFFIFLLHAVTGWLLLAFENPEGISPKSIFARALTEEEVRERLAILIWSWWALWLPWMASQIARLSLGRTVWAACLSSLLFPSLWLLGSQHEVIMFHWQLIHQLSEQAWTKLAVAFSLILFLFYFFRQVYSAKDFAHGGLAAFGNRKRDRSLRIWMNGLIILITSHMIALFMMGWLSVQILSTLGALVMMTVVVGFIVALLSSKDVLSVVKRYKALGKPEC